MICSYKFIIVKFIGCCVIRLKLKENTVGLLPNHGGKAAAEKMTDSSRDGVERFENESLEEAHRPCPPPSYTPPRLYQGPPKPLLLHDEVSSESVVMAGELDLKQFGPFVHFRIAADDVE